jgi:hypothetical protein
MWGLFVASRKATRIGRVHLTAGLAALALCGGLPTQGAMADSTTPWGGLSWGIGIATNFDIGGSRINGATGATIVNNVVRLSDTSSNVGISFVLESHYFFALPAEKQPIFGSFQPPGGCGTNTNCTEWAWGPFIALEIGDGTTSTPTGTGSIAAFAMGMMLGLHHPTLDPKDPTKTTNDKSSWNFGIGLRVDPAAQVLGAGFVANQPPPAGETSVRLQKGPRVGVMLLSSFSF